MLKKVNKNKKGFTLAELLIVVAIIAVLVAISIPIFTGKLEQSRESTDAANLRSAYAEVMAAALTGDKEAGSDVVIKKGEDGAITTITIDIPCKQSVKGWQSSNIDEIGGVKIANIPASALTGWTLTYTASTGTVVFVEKS